MHHHSKISLIASLLLASVAGEVHADAKVMRTIFDAWNQRQHAARRVRYEITSSRIVPQGSLNAAMGLRPTDDPVPDADLLLDRTHSLWVDFETNQCRVQMQGQELSGGAVADVCQISLCDGQNLQQYFPKQKNRSPDAPDAHITELVNHTADGRFPGFFFRPEYYPVFRAHGIFHDDTHGIAPLPSLIHPIQESYFHYDREVTIDDRRLVILRGLDRAIGMTNEYWVDLQQNAAIVRTVHYDKKKNVVKEVSIDYQQTPAGWFPSRWTTTADAGSFVDTLEVTEFEIDPDFQNVVFHIAPTPGTIYRNEENPEQAMVAAETGSEDLTFEYWQILEERSGAKRVWWTMGIAVISVAFGYLWYRRRFST